MAAPQPGAPTTAHRAPALAWSWPDGLRGLVFAVPAGLVTLRDPSAGVPLALGVRPATVLALPGPRRARILLLIVGVLCGLSLLLGGAIAHLGVVGGAMALWLVVVAAAWASAHAPGGQLLLVLAAPLTAAGTSFADWSSAAGACLLMVAGALYAWLVSLLWPPRAATPRVAAPTRPDIRPLLDYGVRMGAAAAIAYLITDSLGLDHPGWAPAACLLVARPSVDLLRLRGVGRVIAVALGAVLAATVVRLDSPAPVLAASLVVVLVATAGSRASRWYITSLFTTYVVFLMMLGEHPEQTEQKVSERINETLLGVALAYLFGWLLPVLAARLGRRTRPDG